MNVRSSKQVGGSPVIIHLYIKKVDEVVKQAIEGRAILEKAVENMFYGDRQGSIKDPFEHMSCRHPIEDVTPAQVKKRAQHLFEKR